MISLTSVLTAIKGTSLATKISLGLSATVIVTGGITGTVIIINVSHSQNATTETANDVPSPKQDNEQTTGIQEPAENKTESNQSITNHETASSSNNSQTTTPKPSNSSASNNSQTSSNPSTSKPTPSTTQPSQPSQPTKKPDYNLNDRYVAGHVKMAFSKQDEAGEWYIAEEKQFFGVTKFTGPSADLYTAVMPQYIAYAEAHSYPHDGGMGAMGLTWEDAIRDGTALDETKCAQYELSCGRW